jgi:hypothetical protein
MVSVSLRIAHVVPHPLLLLFFDDYLYFIHLQVPGFLVRKSRLLRSSLDTAKA